MYNSSGSVSQQWGMAGVHPSDANNSFYDLDLHTTNNNWTKFGVYIFAVPVVLINLIGNGMTVFAFFIDPHLRSCNQNIYIVNLAITDLFLGVIVMPFHLYETANGYIWGLSPWWCKFYLSVDFWTLSEASFTMVLIAYDRMLMIKDGDVYDHSEIRKKAFRNIGITWVMNFLVYVPTILFYDLWRGSSALKVGICEEEFYKEVWQTVKTITYEFTIPLVLLSIFCTMLVVALNRKIQFIRKIEPSLLKGNVVLEKEKELAKCLCFMVIVYAICWTPYTIIHVLDSVCQTCVSKSLKEGTLWLLWFNSAVNPFHYAHFNCRFRAHYKRMLILCCDTFLVLLIRRPETPQSASPSERLKIHANSEGESDYLFYTHEQHPQSESSTPNTPMRSRQHPDGAPPVMTPRGYLGSDAGVHSSQPSDPRSRPRTPNHPSLDSRHHSVDTTGPHTVHHIQGHPSNYTAGTAAGTSRLRSHLGIEEGQLPHHFEEGQLPHHFEEGSLHHRQISTDTAGTHASRHTHDSSSGPPPEAHGSNALSYHHRPLNHTKDFSPADIASQSAHVTTGNQPTHYRLRSASIQAYTGPPVPPLLQPLSDIALIPPTVYTSRALTPTQSLALAHIRPSAQVMDLVDYHTVNQFKSSMIEPLRNLLSRRGSQRRASMPPRNAVSQSPYVSGYPSAYTSRHPSQYPTPHASTCPSEVHVIRSPLQTPIQVPLTPILSPNTAPPTTKATPSPSSVLTTKRALSPIAGTSHKSTQPPLPHQVESPNTEQSNATPSKRKSTELTPWESSSSTKAQPAEITPAVTETSVFEAFESDEESDESTLRTHIDSSLTVDSTFDYRAYQTMYNRIPGQPVKADSESESDSNEVVINK